MNLTPTQKADELIEKFRPFADCPDEYDYELETKNATQCAIIAVDEILNDCDATSPFEDLRLKFWKEVKQILTDRL